MKAIDKIPAGELRDLALHFQNAALSDSTRKAYRSDWKKFLEFCRSRSLESLPASSETICLFLTESAARSKTVNTIVRSLTSINKAHEIAGHPPIRDQAVSATLRGIRREIGTAAVGAKSISYFEILRMAGFCDPSMIGTRDKAILLLGWCSALRRSELVALNIGDLDFQDKGLLVTIKRSKTDPEGRGSTVAIPYAEGILCAVKATAAWIGRLDRNEKSPEKPLFRSIGSGGQKFWYRKPHRDRLSARMVSITVQKYAQLAGLPASRYSAHSLRRGLATEAGQRQIPERIIARHTRHSSMAVLREYIDAGNIWDENPLSIIYPARSRPSSSE